MDTGAAALHATLIRSCREDDQNRETISPIIHILHHLAVSTPSHFSVGLVGWRENLNLPESERERGKKRSRGRGKQTFLHIQIPCNAGLFYLCLNDGYPLPSVINQNQSVFVFFNAAPRPHAVATSNRTRDSAPPTPFPPLLGTG